MIYILVMDVFHVWRLHITSNFFLIAASLGMPHLRCTKVVCRKAFSLFRVLAYTYWGADRDPFFLHHRALILLKLEYCSEICSSATEARLRVLDSVLHAGIRIATGAFRTSPIPSLFVDAGFLSVYDSLRYCGAGSGSSDYRGQLHASRY